MALNSYNYFQIIYYKTNLIIIFILYWKQNKSNSSISNQVYTPFIPKLINHESNTDSH